MELNFLRRSVRGELTTQQIIGLVILITSFVVILFFLFRLDFSEESDKQVCHNSVVLKGKASEFSGGSLDCKTNYVCISSGGDCEGIVANEKIPADSKDQVLKAIANEMADCWWMFGEGEISYTSDYLGTSCAVCSTVRFDESLKEMEVSYEDLFEYLSKTKKTEGQTFYQYLYPYFPELDDLLENFEYMSEKKDENLDLAQSFSIVTGRNKEFNFNEIYPFVEAENNDLIVPVYFIKTSDINTLGCDDFITKA